MTRYHPASVSPPGDTIADILQERGLTVDDLAERTGMTPRSAADLIEGREPIAADLARRLEEAGYRR